MLCVICKYCMGLNFRLGRDVFKEGGGKRSLGIGIGIGIVMGKVKFLV